MAGNQVAPASEQSGAYGFPTSRYIHLNVGGKVYMTSQETLTRHPDSTLGYMFTQDQIPLARDDQGRFLIDRDGKLFRHILNYLRGNKLCLPGDFSEHTQLFEEARFFLLEDLMKELLSVHLNVDGVHYSTTRAILTSRHHSNLADWFSTSPIPLSRDHEGRYKMEGDGQLFTYILNFLEDGHLHLPEKFEHFAELEKEAERYGLDDVKEALEVHLIVGGFEYKASRATLAKVEGSLLDEIFTQTPIPLDRDQTGRYVIHRDGTLFQYILNFLEGGDTKLPKDSIYYRDMVRELEFFKVEKAIQFPIRFSNSRVEVKESNVANFLQSTWKNLTKYKGSSLEQRFADAKISGGRSYAITSDSNLRDFRHILRFLETGNISHVPRKDYAMLLREARSHRILQLQIQLTGALFPHRI